MEPCARKDFDQNSTLKFRKQQKERKWPIHITAEGIFKELDSTSGNLRFAPNKTEKLVDSYQSSAFVKL